MKPIYHCRLVLSASIVLGASVFPALHAQDTTNWLRRSPLLDGRQAHALAYDTARGTTVLFGGWNGNYLSDTWEWDGNTWTLRTPAVSPPARSVHALAYDSARGRVVLFGGQSAAGWMSDTWEWDGNIWTLRSTTGPTGRTGPALAYDSARGKTVLFGGYNISTLFADTWEWDGNTWTLRTPAVSPPARWSHALAYDSARGRTVLFGGGTNVGSGYLSDTWEWNGSTWTLRQAGGVGAPVERTKHAMAYDSTRRKTILYGGHRGPAPNFSYLSDTSEWDGNTWTGAATGPTGRDDCALAYDSTRSRTVLFGGNNGSYLSDTWEYAGSNWLAVSSRSHHALAYDSARGRTVLFGGENAQLAPFSDTLEWDGNTWSRRTPVISPSARGSHAMAYDSARGRTVLFGGSTGSGFLSDTWEWDGNNWAQMPAAGPPARKWHAVAYDSARRRTVLFGGWNGSYLSDTWEWDGNLWTPRTPSPFYNAPARMGHSLAYDSARSKTLLFGGWNGSYLSDTWEWNGSTWTYRAVASPPARAGFPLAYDSAREKVIMFGGDSYSTPLSDIWEWDGNGWFQRWPAVRPSARRDHALAYDSARGKMVLYGGYNTVIRFSDTWEYAPIYPATALSSGPGCAHTGGPMVLSATSLPWLGGTYRYRCTGMAASSLGFEVFGFGPQNTPLSTLHPAGGAGCNLFTTTDSALLLLPVAGEVTHYLALPANPSLVGAVLRNQVLQFELGPTSNMTWLGSSNSLVLTTGLY